MNPFTEKFFGEPLYRIYFLIVLVILFMVVWRGVLGDLTGTD